MKYTLFIDESGDFEVAPRWIVSGLLCRGDPGTTEKRLKHALGTVPSQFGLSSLADLHLTKLRQRVGHGRAIEVAQTTLAAAERTGIIVAMLVAENDRGRGLRESERTYRLMLLDLVALADAALPEAAAAQRLELIVARRKKKGELMSTRYELLEDVVERIEDAVEAGLAARGLIDRIDARQVRIWKAAESAGLALADFVANIAYNRHHSESGAFSHKLEQDGRLTIFAGFGGYAERRARIAERDGDLSAALVRWAMIDVEDDVQQRRETALIRLWERTIKSGTAGPRAILEAVLERLWRNHQSTASFEDLALALGRLEATLSVADGPPLMLYRLRNLQHLVANHRGDMAESDRLVAEKETVVSNLAVDPSAFPLILDDQLLRIVTEENRLDFEATVRLARQHIELVDQYKAVWELLQGESGGEGFLRSRIWLKAQMAMLRALLLSGCSEYLSDEADRLFDNLMNLVDHKSDRNRLDNYRVWADVRSHRWEIALARANKLLDSDDGLYSAQFAARAAADAVLHNREQFRQEAAQILTILRKRVNVGVGHPQDLIWRDVGVLEYCVGDGKKAAIKCMRSCLAATKGLASGPVASWIRLLADIHMETFTGRNGFVAELPSAASALQSQAEELARSTDRLLAYRMVSPF